MGVFSEMLLALAKWTSVQSQSFVFFTQLLLKPDCVFMCSPAGVLSLFSRELPGIRSGEPTTHQPHLHWLHCGGVHWRHSAVLQQLRLRGTGASLLAASRGLPGWQGQYQRASTGTKSGEQPRQDRETPVGDEWCLSETCGPLLLSLPCLTSDLS